MMTDEEANLQRQIEAASKLMMLARSSASEGRLDLTYVYAEELISAATTIRQCALHQLVPAAKRAKEAKDQAEREENELEEPMHWPQSVGNELLSLLYRAHNTPIYNDSAYPPLVEVFAMVVYWHSNADCHASATMHCDLEREDKSVVEPPVSFFDVPTFFANHTAEDVSLDSINFYLTRNQGMPPGDEHFRLLLQLAEEKCRPTIFSAMTRVLVSGSDFRNVTAATFKELFGEVLTALRYHFLNLRQLPEGVEPADLLLYPTLLTSQLVNFSLLPDYERVPLTIKFRPADILAHLKGKSKVTPTRGIDPTAVEEDSPPQFIIHEAYLVDGGEICGVEALVEAIKQDFFEAAAAAPLAEKKKRNPKKKKTKGRHPTREKTEGCHLYPFCLGIAYRRATAFDLRHCGEWQNSLGERLRVCPQGSNFVKMLMPEEYHIEVRRTSGNEP